MNKNATREERLAAKLRENLRRRKSQARGMAECADESVSGSNAGDDAQRALPKSAKES
ncbi:hypothetical protein CP97_00275 [Aurantiacibacter atlanticus]|uniref:Uncharacterized protein n=1 Tax=Aurantiacibacter atlanticus TaxID=1648404 RepID=A0A0H4VCL1_9SPHN|nr:hypothetical protein [Aurantiacibacter atlanticus]AKQ40819.2 hypothetical protein CP97_00275 [Aurantiacibacter atlanticus]MDF1834934.1 hypothetical protein [Alteraurantiacibacter sp. bin_em_oilr2.035]